MKNFWRFISLVLLTLLFIPQVGMAKDEAQKPAGFTSAMAAIKSNKDLSKFADIIDEAGLEKMFEDKSATMTVFAPTNEALGKAPSDLMKKARADKEHLQSFVKYHVISGSQVFMNNLKGRKVGPAAANGEGLLLDGTGKAVKVENADFTTPDIVAGSSIVHIVNAALMPPSLKEKPKEKMPESDVLQTHREEMKGEKKPETAKKPEKPELSKKTEKPESAKTPEAASPAGEASVAPVMNPPADVPVKKKEEGKVKSWLKKLGW